MILDDGADGAGASETSGFFHSSIRTRELWDPIIIVKLQRNVLGVHLPPHPGHTSHIALLDEGIVAPEGHGKFTGQ